MDFETKEVLRLPGAVASLFEDWLTYHEPGKKGKVLGRIKSLRDGKLNDARFGSRMTGKGIFADQIFRLFHAACRKAKLACAGPGLSTARFRRTGGSQMELF